MIFLRSNPFHITFRTDKISQIIRGKSYKFEDKLLKNRQETPKIPQENLQTLLKSTEKTYKELWLETDIKAYPKSVK